MKFFIFLMLSSACYAHSEDIFPNQSAILSRINYSNNLENDLRKTYKKVSVSLYGEELEHILILSPFCSSIKNYSLTGARATGIYSATCRWYNEQQVLKIPR